MHEPDTLSSKYALVLSYWYNATLHHVSKLAHVYFARQIGLFV